MNQSPTFISNIRFARFTQPLLSLCTPRGSPTCIKLSFTEDNSDRLQGFIRQTPINLIIDRISSRTRDQKKILVTRVIILPTEIFGKSRSHAMSRYNSWNNFIHRGAPAHYTPPSASRGGRSRKRFTIYIEYQIHLGGQLSRNRRSYLTGVLIYRSSNHTSRLSHDSDTQYVSRHVHAHTVTHHVGASIFISVSIKM